MGGAKLLAFLGILVWGVSWFLSPHKMISEASDIESAAKSAVDEMGKTISGKPTGGNDLFPYAGPPGWKAFRFTWDAMTDGKEKKGKDWVLVTTCLDNALMVLGLLALIVGAGAGGSRLLGFLLVLGAVHAASWFYLADGPKPGEKDGFADGLQLGYWLWVGSFAIAGIGLLMRRRATVHVM